jgi:ADP-ribose pyrophosphatase YjhB (NUDIX family)
MKDAALGIVINAKDEILLVKRMDVPVWVLPGGGIEPLESPEEAVIREVEEETALRITVKEHIATYTPINCLSSTTHTFFCTPEEKSSIACQKEEVASAQFFSLNKLPDQLFFLHKTFIKEWQETPLFPISRKLTEISYRAFFLYFLRHPLTVLRHLRTRWTKES